MRLKCETITSADTGKPELAFSATDNGNCCVISEERLADVIKQAGLEDAKSWLVRMVEVGHAPLSEAEVEFVKSYVKQPAASV